MSTWTPTVPWTLTPEVTVFAAEHGLTPYLEPVLQLTDRIFPGRRLTAFVDVDPEIAGLRYIAIGVDVTGLTAEQLVETRQAWVRDLFDICPSTHVCWFVLDVEVSA